MIVNGVALKKLNHDGHKVKKWIHDGVKVWSGASDVTYWNDNTKIATLEVDEGLSVLNPSGIEPTKDNYTFLGWNTSIGKAPLPMLIADGNPIDLYACWKRTKYNNLGMSAYKSEYDRVVSGSGGSVVIDTTNASTLTLNITITDNGSYNSDPSISNFFTLNGVSQSVSHKGSSFGESNVTTYHTLSFDISNLSGNYILTSSYSVGGRFYEDVQRGGYVYMTTTVSFSVV